MKKLIIVALFASFSYMSVAQDLYTIDSIRTIYLEFYDSDWETTLEYYYDNDMEDRVLAELTCNDIVYDSVGVRFKGNSSMNMTNTGDKRPFNIKMDFIKDHELYGYTSLKLSNMFKDPSFVREVLSYEIIRNYMPASLANFLIVYTNGSQRGIYASTESVNDDFTQKHFGSDNNAFFKCDPLSFDGPPPTPPAGCISVMGMATAFIELGNDTACYKNYYDIKSNSENDWVDLMDMILALNNNVAEIDALIDVDRSLWMLAFNNIFVNMDSYTGSGHNYYTYKNDSGRFNSIIWDLNETIGCFSNGLDFTQLAELDPFYQETEDERPLISQLFTVDDTRKRYMAHFRTMFYEQLENHEIFDRTAELQTLIDTYVLDDPQKLFTYTEFQNSMTGVIMGSPGIEFMLIERKNYLLTNADVLYTAPTIASINMLPVAPEYTDEVWVSATVSDETNVWLQYRTETYAPFIKLEMFDDGAHNDGAAADGVYAAMIPAVSAATHVDYYIYAENDDAGMFSPERAEYEFYSYTVAGEIISVGDIVINEFLASNDAIQADQDGEFDDWVELYNPTDQDIELIGNFLSDDSTDLLKWGFPDTIIAANSYMIIWTDNDEEQAGLHTNFKLSASGEELIFSNFDSSSIDELVFVAQNTDTTYGRYPNAIGDFEFMPPTYNAENTFFNSINSVLVNDFIKIYPNPVADILYVEFVSNETICEFQIYNSMMQLVENMIVNVHDLKYSINIQDLSNGVYFLRANNYSYKFVVNK